MRIAAAALTLAIAGCGQAAAGAERFPRADRPVAAIVSDRWQDEPTRDRRGEATAVMDAAGVKPGMSVADIGAGEGYYTVRLAARVRPNGRVLAEDIIPAYRDRLAERVAREKLDNVSVSLGLANDARLPAGSFDRIFLIHMYHEIASPYELLWRLRPALKPGGMIAVVDADRPTGQHGTPPRLLDCELAAVGLRRVAARPLPEPGIYLALFRAVGPRPAPEDIRACKNGGAGA